MAGEALPEHIGPYRVTGHLGRGGMGEVLCGHDDRLDRPVALKRVRSGSRDPETVRRRFRREARVVARLNHPAIVGVYDWEEADGEDWLVMERVDGVSLDAVLEDGPLSPERAAKVAREIASGLAAAHEAGLVHRDLKPANVMVTAGHPNRIKILDFGIAKQVELESNAGNEVRPTTLTEAGLVIGTVSYMSPEQALGYPIDHRSDLFSLGTLLYQMLSGVSPFEAGSKVETLSRICGARETPLSDLDPSLPAGLTGLVGRLLEKQPERRPADALEVVAELDRQNGMPQASADAPAAELGAAGPDDATLEMGALDTETAAPRVAPAEKEEDQGTYATPRLYPKWGVPLAAAGALAAAGLWGWSSWLEAPAVDPGAGAASVAITDPDADEELSAYQLFQRGMTLLERYDREGNVDHAIDDFLRALARDEGFAPALAGLAHAYWLDSIRGSNDPQRLEQALAAAERAVQLNEHLAVARVNLGRVYCEMGRFEEAVRELERALQIEPLNAEAWTWLGKVAEAQADIPQAEEYYLRAIDSQPDGWLAYSYLGSFYYHAGRYEEAASSFSRHLELLPDSFLGFSNLGATYYMQGRLGEAAAQFQQALQIHPDPTIYSNLGTIYFTQGLYTQAVSAFEKAIEHGGASNYRQWGNLGDAYRWTPDSEPKAREAYTRAIQLLSEKLAVTPQDINLRTLLPLYHAKNADCDRARISLSTLGDLPGDDGTAWFRIAVANEVCDHRDDAFAALEMALQAGYPKADIEGDPELRRLRQDAGYDRLVVRLQSAGGH